MGGNPMNQMISNQNIPMNQLTGNQMGNQMGQGNVGINQMPMMNTPAGGMNPNQMNQPMGQMNPNQINQAMGQMNPNQMNMFK